MSLASADGDVRKTCYPVPSGDDFLYRCLFHSSLKDGTLPEANWTSYESITTFSHDFTEQRKLFLAAPTSCYLVEYIKPTPTTVEPTTVPETTTVLEPTTVPETTTVAQPTTVAEITTEAVEKTTTSEPEIPAAPVDGTADCLVHLHNGHLVDDVYPVVFNGQNKDVYCRMSSASKGGGWTTFHRRFDGSVSFAKTFAEYAAGFGDASGEYWLGNDFLHAETSKVQHELLVEMTDWADVSHYIHFSSFSVGSAAGGYVLTLSGFSGTLDDNLGYSSGSAFQASGNACALSSCGDGGWWYDSCARTCLNGVYTSTNYTNAVNGNSQRNGMWYRAFHDSDNYSLKKASMMFRRATLTPDCDQLYNAGYTTSAVYTLSLDPSTIFNVYCEMNSGGWTVFQRRQDGSENFARTYEEYVDGFGSLSGEYWLGNEILYRMLTATSSQLRVEMTDWDDVLYPIGFSSFTLSSSATFYVLSVTGYNGTIDDSLSYANGKRFSGSGENCAITSCGNGGWWYGNCAETCLNGVYTSTGYTDARNSNGQRNGVWYRAIKSSDYYSLKKTVMMIRPA